ncbi:MAG: mercury(II) reductase [Leptospirales bacterium]
MKSMTFSVQGMTCDHCARTVEQTLLQIPDVTGARVSFEKRTAEVDFQKEVSFPFLRETVRHAGYDLEETGAKDRTAPPKAPSAGETNLHVAIVGAGSGAFAAAIRAAEGGARVTLIERGTVGGTCVNVGCVPSKILIRQAHHAHDPLSQPFKGIHSEVIRQDPHLLKVQLEDRVLELREKKYVQLLKEYPSITMREGAASFIDDRTLSIKDLQGSETVLEADRILIATGGRPAISEIPGLASTPFWTSTEALFSGKIPDHLIVVGGGFVALELGQSYRRLGAKVTIIQRRDQLLNRMDPDLGKELQTYLEAEGIRVLLNTSPRSVEHRQGVFQVDLENERLKGDALLVATGRIPNTEGLGLERAGVETDQSGAIVIDDALRTTNPHVWAVGDCTTLPKFVYVAAKGGTIAAKNMMGGDARMDVTVLPEVIFTDPQVATVGLTIGEAQALGLEVESRRISLDLVPRALVNFDTRGFVKIVAEKSTGKIVGVQILAPEGGEVIQTAAMAIMAGRTVSEIADQLFPYLTMVESLKLCAQSFSRDVSKLSCCAG